MDDENGFLYICDLDHKILTTITKDDVEYLKKLVLTDLGEKGFWYENEESVFETVELLNDYFTKRQQSAKPY